MKNRTIVAQEPSSTRSSAARTPPAGVSRTVPRGSPNSSTHTQRAASTHAPVRIERKPERIDDDGQVGANTYLYLNRAIPKLVVEIDAVRNDEPAPSAIGILRTRLTEVVDKPGGVVFLPIEIIPRVVAGDSKHSMMENTEKRYRTHHSTASAIVLYVLYVDGDANGAIGTAYSSSSYAVFKQAIASASTPLVTAEEIEDSVIVHEAGHVLALVNIGYTSPRDHEDPGHPGHSTNAKSVMYWAVDNTGVVALLGGSTRPPTSFDANDLADLRDLRDGKLK